MMSKKWGLAIYTLSKQAISFTNLMTSGMKLNFFYLFYTQATQHIFLMAAAHRRHVLGHR